MPVRPARAGLGTDDGYRHIQLFDHLPYDMQLLVILLPNTAACGCTMLNSFSTTVHAAEMAGGGAAQLLRDRRRLDCHLLRLRI
jgi:hypothetical protein